MFISAYAPTMTNPVDIRDQFYEELNSLVTAVPKTEKLIILGDFNARVGVGHQSRENVLGKNGIGRCNSNGFLLLQLCAEHELLVTNTVFHLPARNRTSLMHPRSKHWHLIDYVIVRQRDRQDVRVTKAMCAAECWTNHRLIISKINIRILPKRRSQGKPAPKRLNVVSLKKQAVSTELKETLEERAQQIEISDNVVESWEAFWDDVYRAAYKTIGQTKRKHQDWFDENNDEVNNLPEEKYRSQRVFENKKSSANQAAYNNICSPVQQKLRQMQDSWLKQEAEEIQNYADMNDMKRFYDAIKRVYGPRPVSPSPLLSTDGKKLLTEKAHVLDRWAEHFDAVLNRPPPAPHTSTRRLSTDCLKTPSTLTWATLQHYRN